MIRAVVVDDSHVMRTMISNILEEASIEVVGRARDGTEALDLIAAHEPDVVTMDVEMPGMDGIEAVERIMETTPTPILMVSAHTDEEAETTFDALEKGAVDFFTKPGGEVSVGMQRYKDQLVRNVRAVARSDVTGNGAGVVGPVTTVPERRYLDEPTLVVGASTGGPNVIQRILAELPVEPGFRIAIVQHMPDGFTGRFAERLDRNSAYAVREAEDGAVIGGGEAVVAKGGFHLTVADWDRGRLRIRNTREPPENGVRPAVDVTMRTAAATVDGPLVGVVLTGLGRDGAAGVEAIKAVGGDVIVQDESTSAVFGMPDRAIETGCVDRVLPADDVPGGILDCVTEDQ